MTSKTLTHTPPPPIADGRALFLALARGRFTTKDGFDEFKNRGKFVMRSLATLPWTLDWLSQLTASPQRLAWLHHAPRVALKLHRPYLYRGLSVSGRLKVLSQHYQLMEALFPAAVCRDLMNGKPLMLGDVEGKNGVRIRFRLTLDHHFDKEGELSLQVIDGDDTALSTLTFSLHNLHGEPALCIGGLQGPRTRHGHEGIQTATRACHGLFPKRLGVEALLTLARALGIGITEAVGNRNHVYRSIRYRRRFLADYESFWESLDGSPAANGFFRLPLAVPRKTMAEIASKKRSEYQRRYALLDSLTQQVENALSQPLAVVG